jgi:hypothetical protein
MVMHMPLALIALLATALPGEATRQPRAPVPQALVPVPVQQCARRVGPFATQGSAWQRRNQAQGRGYAVSGVFPCYDGRSRGYCFNVFTC